MKLVTTIHEDSTSFAQLHVEWHTLLAESSLQKVFFTPEYQSIWWHTLGKNALKIIAIRSENGQLIGLAPLHINNQVVSFVGCKDVSDYLDCLVHPQYPQEVYAEIAQTLADLYKTNQVKKIELCSIPQGSATLELLPSLFTKLLSGASITIHEQDVCPRIALPETFEAYLNQLARKQRHELKRKWRKIDQVADIRFRCVTEVSDASNAVETFITLHQLSSSEKHDFWNDHHRSFFERLLPEFAANGWLKLFFLEVVRWKNSEIPLELPTQPIAAMLIFDFNNEYNLYNSGYNSQYASLSAGQVLTAHTISTAIQEKKAVYDFLRGNEEYKFRLGGVASPVFDMVLE